MNATIDQLKQDVEDMAKEIEAFFAKLLARVDGDDAKTADLNAMKGQCHAIAATTPPTADTGTGTDNGAKEVDAPPSDTEAKAPPPA